MNTDLIRVTVPCGQAAIYASVPALFVPDVKASGRFFESSTTNFCSKNPRRAYDEAVCHFAWNPF
jgi:hypothetical protein